MTGAMISIIRRELLIAFRRQADILNPLWFFIIVVTLFPLSIGPEPNLLARISSGVVWVAALLSALLSLERLFRDDFQDGALEQMMLMPVPLPLAVMAKVIAHWILTGVPLILISPLLAILLSLDFNTWSAVVLTLLVGTPTLSFIGAIGVALTVGLQKGGVLLSLLVLPLYIPILIFATSAIDAAGLGVAYNGQIAILGAMLAGAATLTPFAISASLRISVN
ncbi:heme exporter protein CcmB [Vibrio sp. vnigr-6D03]|uniref:Heme exporter protein B n=1 Tax=Vibrio penaeicida TaxID=104609 RepID=A0AAV5NY50_9VIBR|nr:MULTISPECIES: heme exporter protein CcmB [Vibrio]PKF79053.1 heme exporter protein CcmB [Vibrio sp. vnigr-6D03]RTZ21540.1 heme exporter protein CcmB [Vibrio penaeicida]GLQ75239.1 heme exporter protein B [Vibrio penaeicida]